MRQGEKGRRAGRAGDGSWQGLGLYRGAALWDKTRAPGGKFEGKPGPSPLVNVHRDPQQTSPNHPMAFQYVKAAD